MGPAHEPTSYRVHRTRSEPNAKPNAISAAALRGPATSPQIVDWHSPASPPRLPLMNHSKDRIDWLTRAYKRIRAGILEEAPPEATFSVGFPVKKRTGKDLTLGEFHPGVIEGAEGGFGAENLIVIHPVVLDRPTELLVVLTHQMVHASLDPELAQGHGKEFQAIASRIGLMKPWPVPQADDTLWNYLLGVGAELGDLPAGVYVPPPTPPKKKSALIKYRCSCMPYRELSLSPKKLEHGSIICGSCRERFRSPEEIAQSGQPL